MAIAAIVTLVPAAASAASAPALGSRTLATGMTGADVSALQKDLTEAGFATPVTGRFSSKTAQEVQNFETQYNLPVNGQVNVQMVETLEKVIKLDKSASDASTGGSGISVATSPATPAKSTTKAAADPTSVLSSNPVLAPVAQNGKSAHLGNRTLHQGLQGHDVKVLQDYLTLDGYPTTVDGDFGPSTEKSVVKWQSANGLADNGVLTYSESRKLREDVAQAMTATSASSDTADATLNSDGTVTAPAGAPEIVQEVIAAANSIIDTPYIYGGGHQSFSSPGYDCSGAVSFALNGGGLLSAPEDSTQLETYGSPGAGQYITVYANAGHAWMTVDGLAFDTAHYGTTYPSGSGPRWLPAADATANLNDGTGGYVVRHPTGL